MTKTPPHREWFEPSLEQMRAGAAEVIDEDWKDDIVERLLRELKRQLCQLENTKPTPETDQANIRSVNVKTLANIERTLDRILRLEEQRALKRETKVTANKDNARAELERRLDQLATTARAPGDPGRSE